MWCLWWSVCEVSGEFEGVGRPAPTGGNQQRQLKLESNHSPNQTPNRHTQTVQSISTRIPQFNLPHQPLPHLGLPPRRQLQPSSEPSPSATSPSPPPACLPTRARPTNSPCSPTRSLVSLGLTGSERRNSRVLCRSERRRGEWAGVCLACVGEGARGRSERSSGRPRSSTPPRQNCAAARAARTRSRVPAQTISISRSRAAVEQFGAATQAPA